MEHDNVYNITGWLSPSAAADMDTKEFTGMLISRQVFKSEKDIRLFILENILRVSHEDCNSEFPIHYYENGEPFTEEEYLTDSYIQKMD